MDTLDFYQTNAVDFFSQTIDVDMKNLYQCFFEHLPKGEQIILDVGCGSGRDSVYFVRLGFDVTAIDGSQELIELAQGSDAVVDWHVLNFKDIKKQPWQNKFTGIWACASLLHAPFRDLPKLLNEIVECLQLGGVLYVSFKYGDSDRIKEGRFFCDLNEERWKIIENQLDNVDMLGLWQTKDNRVDRQEIWLNVIICRII